MMETETTMSLLQVPRPFVRGLALVLALVLALSGVLAGCASSTLTAPTVTAAIANVRASAPVSWLAPLPTEGTRFTAPINDPELPNLLAAARAASPTLATAAARIERSRALRVAAEAGRQPRLDASASVQTGRVMASAPRSDTLSVGVQAGWEIDLFGARAALATAAEARLASTQARLQSAHQALAAEVASSLVALRACVVQRELSAADSRSREATSRLTGLREKAGFAAPAEAALARASAAQGRSLHVVQTAACQTQLKALVELTALAQTDFQARLLDTPRDVPQGYVFAVSEVPAQLLTHRPDLVDAGQGVMAAAAEVAVAQAARYPSLSLAGSIGLGRSHSGGFTQQGSTWSLGPLQLTLPLFDAGQRGANESAARAEYDAAVISYQAALRRAVREVEQALVALQSSAAREGDAIGAARDFELALRATEARYRGGLASLFELEDARRTTLAAQSGLIDLQRERALAWIDLGRALGAAPATP